MMDFSSSRVLPSSVWSRWRSQPGRAIAAQQADFEHPLSGAKRVLEIGLLGGYSATWLACAIGSNGKLVTLEIDEKSVRVAGKNLERAGLRSQVEIRHGDARATLKNLVKAGEPPFDLVFIDTDKNNYPVYLDYALQLTHPGSLILADNVIRRIADTMVSHEKPKPGASEPLLAGYQEFNHKLAANPKLESIVVTVTREFVDGLGNCPSEGLILKYRRRRCSPAPAIPRQDPSPSGTPPRTASG